MEGIKVLDTVKEHKGKQFGTATMLDADGELVVNQIAQKIVKKIDEINQEESSCQN